MKRISEYNNITNIAENDVLPIVDVSDTEQATTGSTKKGTIEKIADYLKSRVETLTNKTLTSPVINTPSGDIVTPTGTQTLTNKTLTSPVLHAPTVDTISEHTLANGVDIDNCLIKDGKAEDSDKVDGLHVHSSSTVITLTANANNTITHNLGTTSQRIIAINGDYNANAFTITGVSYVNSNSFSFYASGGASGAARINYIIFY